MSTRIANATEADAAALRVKLERETRWSVARAVIIADDIARTARARMNDESLARFHDHYSDIATDAESTRSHLMAALAKDAGPERHIFYEGDDPERFVSEVKALTGFDPSADASWGEVFEAGTEDQFTSYAFDCPGGLYDLIYHSGRWPMGS